MLGLASSLDLWKRTVHDLLWAPFGIIAIVLVFLEPNFSDALIRIAISLIIAPLALIIWRVGVFGGADAFCLIVLAALAPQITLSNNFVTPITTLTNAAMLSTVILFVNATRNAIAILNHNDIFEGFEETILKKVCAVFLGYRSKNPKHSFSIQRIERNHKKLVFSLHHAENAEFCKTSDSWVTPGIPYIVYIMAGFIVQLVFGDLVINLVKLL